MKHDRYIDHDSQMTPIDFQVGALVQGQQAQAEDGASPDNPAVKRISPFKFLTRSRIKPNGDIPGVNDDEGDDVDDDDEEDDDGDDGAATAKDDIG
ncbi:hypothetical protein DPMN_096153 [Dreissena polymorpha]|uniref:Uncharacterized protein n=1 Tax=Dreissena polymorpha TaxID=45954 RepID=A0A9D4R4H2_DREPO|nr:hypothetical protein DPMN_096153 [Dreissena polymorpha]